MEAPLESVSTFSGWLKIRWADAGEARPSSNTHMMAIAERGTRRTRLARARRLTILPEVVK
jgi:hypothetical protein